MCGIVSLISRRSSGFFGSDLELFEQLLVLDTLRGLDSTGAFCVDHQRNVGYMKVASHPYHLFACNDYNKWRGKAVNSGRILVGHNRKATQGAIKSENAHPFHENNIILVHNGTLRGDHKKQFADREVDSHALCTAINEKGAEAVLPTINGAFALMWWDIEKGRLFAIRNDERPLNIVVTEDNYILLSEAWMAQALLSRANKKVLDVIDIKPGLLYEFEIGGKFTTKEIDVQKDYWSNNTATRHYGGGSSSSVTPPKSGQVETKSTNSSTEGKEASAGTSTTALTLVKNTTGATTDGTTAAANMPNVEGWAGHVECLDYPRSQDVLVRMHEMKLSDNGVYYVMRGHAIEPGQEMIDVLAHMPAAAIPDGEQRRYLGEPVMAEVRKHTQSNCGRSIFVTNLRPQPKIDVHNIKMTEHEWKHVVTNCRCAKCEAVIYDEEKPFTSVSRRPNNKFAVTCADCVEDTLIGEFKHAFNQDRLASIQTHLGQRNGPDGSINGGTGESGSATVH